MIDALNIEGVTFVKPGNKFFLKESVLVRGCPEKSTQMIMGISFNAELKEHTYMVEVSTDEDRSYFIYGVPERNIQISLTRIIINQGEFDGKKIGEEIYWTNRAGYPAKFIIVNKWGKVVLLKEVED